MRFFEDFHKLYFFSSFYFPFLAVAMDVYSNIYFIATGLLQDLRFHFEVCVRPHYDRDKAPTERRR